MALMNDHSIERFGFLVHDAARLLRRRFEVKGRELGLSAAQWRAMVQLVRRGPMTQAKLAELLEIEPISVSRLIDRMEQGGWVIRKADETDRRAKMVHATDSAREAFGAVKAIASDLFDQAMTGLDDRERAALIAALETVVANLSQDDDAETSARTKEQA